LDVTVEPGDQWYECGEFPGSLAASDPGAYHQYEHDTELQVNCWELDNTGELYLKTVEDECFIREYFIYYNETLDITYEDALPRCRPHRPFQAWWGKPGDPSTGGSVDTDLGPCYHCPSTDCDTSDVDYLMLHVYCWIDGESFNNNTYVQAPTFLKCVHISINDIDTVNGGTMLTKVTSMRNVMCQESYSIELNTVSTSSDVLNPMDTQLTHDQDETGSGGRCPQWDKPTEEPDRR
jgi:hypothetical protein